MLCNNSIVASVIGVFVLMNMLIFVTLHVLLYLQVKAISDNA